MFQKNQIRRNKNGLSLRTTSFRINLGSIAKAEDLKKRILFTLLALIVYRIGSYIPVPGIDPVALEKVFERNVGGILGMFDMFAGGALGRMTIFALNIMPYISASIIMQLLTVISPQLEQLKKEGETGRKKNQSICKIWNSFPCYGSGIRCGCWYRKYVKQSGYPSSNGSWYVF